MALNNKLLWIVVLVAAFWVAAAAVTTTVRPGPAHATTPPSLSQPCGTDDGLGCAPQSERVDLYKPVFSNPTEITNPLFPVSDLHSVVMLGEADGEKLRIEVTLLPETRVIDLGGGKTVETLVVQFAAYLGGRIHEVALDHYAQDDLGAVWYLGEDVFNYEDGEVADTDGTWLAGQDGPAAMIMPADPQVGDVYRPENAPGFVFEEVVVTDVGVTVDGPSGPVDGAIIVDELHMDGMHEDKTFAPGYGEFIAGDELLALAVPTDALGGSTPRKLRLISAQADEVLDAIERERWSRTSARLGTMTSSWERFKQGEVPALLEEQMDQALEALADGIEAEDSEAASQAAIDVGQASQDLQLRHKPPAKIDRARLELWGEQLLVDAAAEDAGAVKGDVTTMEWIRDRIAHTFRQSDRKRIDDRIAAVREAADAEDLDAAADATERLLDTLERAR
jgi:hypothetical protein